MIWRAAAGLIFKTMKRDEKGRLVFQRVTKPFPEPTREQVFLGDNLNDSKDDETENDYLNWRNNPLRDMFDNHTARFHRSALGESDSFPE